MSLSKPSSRSSTSHNSGKNLVIYNLNVMKRAMREMGAEHVNFHEHFADVQKRLEDMKKAYSSNNLDVEVIRATALDPYLSDGNLPKVMAFGHLELEKVLKEFKEEEEKLDHLQKETARLVEILSGARLASQT